MARGKINLTFRDLHSAQAAAPTRRAREPKASLRQDTGPERQPPPVRIQVGHRNYNVAPQPSAAALGQELRAAFKSLEGDLKWFTDQLEAFLPEDMMAALQPAYDKSQIYVPVDTGALKESGYLVAEHERGRVNVEIGYGRNGDPEYAVIVHEMPTPHAAPTRDKFLQAAIDEHYNEILQILSDRMRVRIGAT